MPQSALFAISENDVLAGGNRFAVETATGWEIFGVADITLIGESTYRLTRLLRGLSNSDDMMMAVIAPGARVIALDEGLADLSIDDDYIGQTIEITISAAGRPGVPASVDYHAAHLRPLSVVHISAKSEGAETDITWIPRNLDNTEYVDPAAEVLVSWPSGAMTVTGLVARIPVEMGSDTLVRLTPIDPIGGTGIEATIRV